VFFKFNKERPIPRKDPTWRDHLVCNITLKKGLTGAKPEAFADWVFRGLNLKPDDEFHDLFPGTGIITECHKKFVEQHSDFILA